MCEFRCAEPALQHAGLQPSELRRSGALLLSCRKITTDYFISIAYETDSDSLINSEFGSKINVNEIRQLFCGLLSNSMIL